MTRTRLIVLALGVALCWATLASADPAQPATPGNYREGWWLDGLGYGWAPGVFGHLSVDDRKTTVDESVGDTFDNLLGGNAFAGSAIVELGHDRWSVLVDAFGGYSDGAVRESLPTPLPGVGIDLVAKLKVKQVFVDFDVAYRLGQWTLPGRTRPLTLGIYAGARSSWTYSRVRASAQTTGLPQNQARSLAASEAIAWADPLIGVRWELPLLDELVVDFRGDVGGFGAGSSFAWGIMSGLRYWLPWELGPARSWLGGGYKIVAFDHDLSRGRNADLTFGGPYLGMGIGL